MKIIVDNQEFKSKRKALDFFKEAYFGTDGSEQDRMAFAFWSIQDGYNKIDTYKEIAEKC